ncbi:MAG: hypothetical protein E6R03_06795 [Hyphomicrobiaceae bacterium]|nr:MAG: hypothetical protein E6R03_06795 [Hyphomicrobiaceae bacterium]
MTIYAFAFRGTQKLTWVTYDGPDEAGAIKKMRADFGSIEPYAGPLVQRCSDPNCNNPAITKIGQSGPRKVGWIPVCAAHSSVLSHNYQIK